MQQQQKSKNHEHSFWFYSFLLMRCFPFCLVIYIYNNKCRLMRVFMCSVNMLEAWKYRLQKWSGLNIFGGKQHIMNKISHESHRGCHADRNISNGCRRITFCEVSQCILQTLLDWLAVRKVANLGYNFVSEMDYFDFINSDFRSIVVPSYLLKSIAAHGYS